MRRRNVTGVILDPKAGTQEVRPRVWKKASRLYRERDDLTTSTRLAIDPTTARKSRKRLGGKTDHPARPSLRARNANNDVSFVLFISPG